MLQPGLLALLAEHTKVTPVLESFMTQNALAPVLPLALSYSQGLLLKTASLEKPSLSTSSKGDPVTLSYCPFTYLIMVITLFIGLLSILSH